MQIHERLDDLYGDVAVPREHNKTAIVSRALSSYARGRAEGITRNNRALTAEQRGIAAAQGITGLQRRNTQRYLGQVNTEVLGNRANRRAIRNEIRRLQNTNEYRSITRGAGTSKAANQAMWLNQQLRAAGFGSATGPQRNLNRSVNSRSRRRSDARRGAARG